MLKSFFKWIADHTGISWIAKKVSSYWNWLFSSKANTAKQDVSQQKKSLGNEKQETHIQSKNNTLPKIPNGNQPTFSKQNDNTSNQSMLSENNEPVSKADTNVKLTENSLKPNVVQQNTKPGSYFRFNDNKLLFFTTNENYKVLEEKCKNEDGNGKVIPGEFRIFVECGSEKFCITGPHSSCQDVDDGKKSVSITSVRKQNVEGTVSKDPLEMMYKVGLDENKKLVEITRMSINPFETTTPNLNATTIQRTVNNDSETTTTDQQRTLNPELVANEPKAVGELKFDGEKLLLVTTSDQFAKCKDYRNTQSANPDELLMFIKCGANEYRIVGNSTVGSILIKSILIPIPITWQTYGQ